MPTLLFLGASVSQLAAMRQARATGLTVVAVDGDGDAVGFPYADVAVQVDFSDVESVVAVARRHLVDGVVAISTDRAVPVAAAVAERLGLPGIGTGVAVAMTDKGVMRERLRAHGVPQPEFRVIASRADVRAACAGIGFPAVLKPVDSGGQRGLHRVVSLAELCALVPDALAYSRSGRVILERHVAGNELNAILVVRRGVPHVVALSDRLRPPGVGFGVGWAHLFPSHLPPETLVAAADVACAAVRALGLRDGIAFPQLLVERGGEVSLVEIAARIPAGQMADVVRHGVGVDLFAVAFRFALGLAVPDELFEPRFAQPLAVCFFTAAPGMLPTGRVVAVDGLERVRSAPGVVQAGSYLVPGETIRPVQVDADRRGFVIATADDPMRALALAGDAADLLSVRVESRSVAATR